MSLVVDEVSEISLPEAAPLPRVQPQPAGKRPATAGLFRVVWRWHFYAGLVTSPFLLTLAVTGFLYIFSPEIQHYLRRDLLDVEPGTRRVLPSVQVDAALRRFPDRKMLRLTSPPEPTRSTLVVLGDKSGKPQFDVYINPYTGLVLGAVDPQRDTVRKFFRTVLDIHRRLFIGTTGRVIVELVTCWGVVLLVTGVYLWWPRRREKVQGVWLPRLKRKPYVVLRDLHALTGIYLLPVLLLIAATGMVYTVVWGKGVSRIGIAVHNRSSGAASTTVPPSPAKRKLPRAEREAGGAIPLGLVDETYRLAREEYPDRSLLLDLKTGTSTKVTVHAFHDPGVATYGPYRYARLDINPQAARVSGILKQSENPGRWWRDWAYPLHVGSFWGLATKVPWTLACLVLAGMPVTGVWMWWKRRPTGSSGFPHRVEYRWPWWLTLLVSLSCLSMPLFGGSVVAVAVLDAGWRWFRRSGRRTTGLAST